MKLRAYQPGDLEACKALHAQQGFAYPFPNLDSPLFMIKLVGEADGRVVQAAFAHLTAEIYFLQDPKWRTPQERLLAFLCMQEVGKSLAYKPGGLEDLHAFVPPQIEKPFGKRLSAHGWQKVSWPCFVTEV